MKTRSITMPALRIKLTGRCNRSCSFCHEEGDMKRIEDIVADEFFFQCVKNVMEKTGIKRVMLTGGEPTLHKELKAIISGLKSFSKEISITTNGINLISVNEWVNLKDNGLTKVIISIHDTSANDLLRLESKKRP